MKNRQNNDKKDEKKEMFFYLKGTEPTQGNKSKDLEAVFKEENIINTEDKKKKKKKS